MDQLARQHIRRIGWSTRATWEYNDLTARQIHTGDGIMPFWFPGRLSWSSHRIAVSIANLGRQLIEQMVDGVGSVGEENGTALDYSPLLVRYCCKDKLHHSVEVHTLSLLRAQSH